MMIFIYVTHFQVERCFPTTGGSTYVWELGGGSVKFPLQQPIPAHALSHGTWSCTWHVLLKGGELMNIGLFCCWQRVGRGIVQSYIFYTTTSLAEWVRVWGPFLRWWSSSTMWAGHLIILYHHQGCLNNPINLNLWVMCYMLSTFRGSSRIVAISKSSLLLQ